LFAWSPPPPLPLAAVVHVRCPEYLHACCSIGPRTTACNRRGSGSQSTTPGSGPATPQTVHDTLTHSVCCTRAWPGFYGFMPHSIESPLVHAHGSMCGRVLRAG